MAKAAARNINIRVMRIIGDINELAFENFSEELHEAEINKEKKVIVELSSSGGSAYDALAFYSRMKNSLVEIEVHVYGYVASAAVLVLAAGDIRLMAREAWVMVHEDSVQKLTAKVTDLETNARHMRRLEDQWNALLAKNSSADAVKWGDLHKRETHLSAYDCIHFGLVEGYL